MIYAHPLPEQSSVRLQYGSGYARTDVRSAPTGVGTKPRSCNDAHRKSNAHATLGSHGVLLQQPQTAAAHADRLCDFRHFDSALLNAGAPRSISCAGVLDYYIGLRTTDCASSPASAGAVQLAINQMIEENPSLGYRTVAHLLQINKNSRERIFQLMRWQVKKQPPTARKGHAIRGFGE